MLLIRLTTGWDSSQRIVQRYGIVKRILCSTLPASRRRNCREAQPQPTPEEFGGHGKRLPMGKPFRAELSISTCNRGTNSPSEPLRDRSGVQYAVFVKGTQADHAIIVLHLTGIDIVHCLTVVLLTGPLGRTVVLDSPLDIRAPIPNHQGRLILIASRDNTLHTVLLHVLPFRRFRALLCEHRC